MKSIFKKIKIILIVSFLFISNYNYGQDYFLNKYSSGLTGQYFWGESVHELPNNNYAIIANDSYKGGWLLLTDSIGQLLMAKHIHGFAQYMDSEFFDFMLLNDGNYLIVGNFNHSSSNSYRGLIKVNTQGDIIWGKHLGNSGFNGDFFVKHKNGKQSLISNNWSSNGYKISALNDYGDMVSTIRIRDSLNGIPMIKVAKPLPNNGLVIGGKIDGQPIVMSFDSSYNNLFSLKYTNYFDIHDIIPTKDNGFLYLFRDTTFYYSFHIIKADSLGNPIWAKTFTDSLKFLFPKLLYENDNNTIYCLITWKDIYSPVFNYNGAIILIDSIGDVISIKDSLVIQSFIDLKRTSNNKFCALLARGSSNNNRPAIWITDTLFNQATTCMQYSNTTAIVQSNSSATFVSSPIKILNDMYSPISFTVFEELSTSNITQVCLPTGIYETLSESNENSLIITPNPNNGEFRLNSPAGYLQIYNYVGQLIYSSNIISEERYINLPEFSDGVYFIILNTEKELITNKFVIHK